PCLAGVASFRARDVLGATDDRHAHTRMRSVGCAAISKRDVGRCTFGGGAGAEALWLAVDAVPALDAQVACIVRRGVVVWVVARCSRVCDWVQRHIDLLHGGGSDSVQNLPGVCREFLCLDHRYSRVWCELD